jgi:hypothetical protein
VLKLSSRPLSLFIHLVDASYYALRGILGAHDLAARCVGLKVPVVFFVLAGLGGVACAQSLLKVVPPVWMALTQEEKDSVQKRFLVEVAEPESLGIIVDTQGVNESTPGDNAGSSLGSAVASAAYIDRAINHRNYSAKSHLGVALLGGLLGSALDAKPVQQFHYRYAVKFLSGNIRYFDVVSADPFRHPAGVCVAVPAVAMLPDQGLCTQTAAMFRSTYLGGAVPAAPVAQPAAVPAPATPVSQAAPSPAAVGAQAAAASPRAVDALSPDLVLCKLNTLAPVRTTAEKCKLINGSLVNE